MKNMSFKQKLFIIGVIPVMILGALIGFFSFNQAKSIVTKSHKEVIDDAVYRINSNLNTKVHYLTESIRFAKESQTAKKLIQNYNNDTRNQEINSEMEIYCEGIASAFNAISTISVISGYDVLFSTNTAENIAINRSVMDELQNQIDNNPKKIFWSDLGTSIYTNSSNISNRVISAFASIQDDVGNVIGLMIVELSPKSLGNILLDNQKILNYQYSYIVDNNGEIICAEQNGYPRYYDVVEEQFNKGIHRFMITWNDKPYYTCGQYNGLTGWKTFSVISEQNLFADSVNLKTYITRLVIGAMFLMLIAILIMYQSIMRPLNNLSKAMKTAQDKDFELQLVNDRNDEIGQLTDSFNYMVNKINLLIKEVYQQKLTQKTAEIEALQAQINPHFLYNALDSINWMLIDRGEMDISEIIVSLGELMHYSIDTENAMVTLDEEYNYIKDYLCIQKNRLEERLQYSLEIEQPLRQLLVPKLILQPLVENSIKHAIEHSEKQGFIKICSSLVNGKIHISVRDNGNGMTTNQLKLLQQPDKNIEGRTGIGIKNVSRRLKLFFGEDSELQMESDFNIGTTMTIVIPVTDKRIEG